MTDPLLRVENLTMHFPVKGHILESVVRAARRQAAPVVHAVDGVSFALDRGGILGLVGESGCGKTTTGRCVLRLVQPTGGRIVFEGRDITTLSEAELRGLRPRMQIVFQDPHAALNPTMTIGQSIQDPLLIHGQASEVEAKEATLAVMEEVGLAPAADLFDKYPADVSGGQKQRAVIARAIILRPSLIVADEPVAMLDMSIRAKILELLLGLRDRYGLSYLMITHDLATAKFVCDRIAIMYLGRIVEMGPAEAIYRDPKHPYTKALIAAIPAPEPGHGRAATLPRGEVPDAIWPPVGCRFHPRCPAVLPTCGWEGRDFVDYLGQVLMDSGRSSRQAVAVGPIQIWEADGHIARRPLEDLDPATALDILQDVVRGGPEPMARAVEAVRIDGDELVVSFRQPTPLPTKEIEGRLVECLLY